MRFLANLQDIEAGGEIDGRRPGRNQLRRLHSAGESVGSKLRRLRSGDYDCARHGAEGDFVLAMDSEAVGSSVLASPKTG